MVAAHLGVVRRCGLFAAIYEAVYVVCLLQYDSARRVRVVW